MEEEMVTIRERGRKDVRPLTPMRKIRKTREISKYEWKRKEDKFLSTKIIGILFLFLRNNRNFDLVNFSLSLLPNFSLLFSITKKKPRDRILLPLSSSLLSYFFSKSLIFLLPSNVFSDYIAIERNVDRETDKRENIKRCHARRRMTDLERVLDLRKNFSSCRSFLSYLSYVCTYVYIYL